MGKVFSVSVVVPAYNSEATVGQTISALLGQDYPKESFEIFVVDDGSKDSTANVIKEYPVRYFHQKNSGPASARNLGASVAKGELILFTDSDCVPDADWIREMTRPFSDPEVIAVKGAYRTEQAGVIARFSQMEFEERFELLKKAPSIDMVDTYSAAFRAEVFKRLGGFDTTFPVANNEDTELSYRMSRQGLKMVFNPKAVVRHLNHPDSVKRYARIKFWRGYWRMVVYRMYPDKMLKDTYTPQALKLQTLFLAGIIGSLPVSVISTWGLYALLAMAALFTLSALPFTALAFRKDPAIAVLSPAFLLLRAASIGSGALWGTINKR